MELSGWVKRLVAIILFAYFSFYVQISLGQTKLISGVSSSYSGILKMIREKDAVWGNERLSFYLYFDSPTVILTSDSGDSKEEYLSIKRTTLFEVYKPNIELYIGKKVVVNGHIDFPNTMHYNSETAIFDITDVYLKGPSNILKNGFYLGQEFSPSYRDFELTSIDKEKNIYTYKFIGISKGRIFDRSIADVILRLKGDRIVTIIYDLIPNSNDIGTPLNIVDNIQSSLTVQLANRGGVYGVSVDSMSMSISRTNNPMTFNKDRIMYVKGIKSSLLADY